MKADGIKHYVDWAVKKGFAIIDANIPKHLTGLEASIPFREDLPFVLMSSQDDGGYMDEDINDRIVAANQLATYLWDNYIE